MWMKSVPYHISDHMLQYSRCSSSLLNADLLDIFMKHQLQSNMPQPRAIPRSKHTYCVFIGSIVHCAPFITQSVFSKLHEMNKRSSSVRARYEVAFESSKYSLSVFNSGLGTNETGPWRYPSVKGALLVSVNCHRNYFVALIMSWNKWVFWQQLHICCLFINYLWLPK